MIGMEIFGDTIKAQDYDESNPLAYNCHNPRLADTDFAKYYF